MPLSAAQNLDAAILAKTAEINGAFASRPDATGAAGNSVAWQAYFNGLQKQLADLMENRCKPQIDGINYSKSQGIS